MLSYLKTIPGAAWVALITAIIGWLQGDWFVGQAWVPIVVILLGALLQILRVYVLDQGDGLLRHINREQSRVSRVFWGDK